MINSTNVFFVIPNPIFNHVYCRSYHNFTKEDSSYLYITLLLNLYEIFSSVLPKEDLFLCLDNRDQEIVSGDASSPFLLKNVLFFDEATFTNDYVSLFDKKNPGAKNFIFVRPKFVGLTTPDILQIFDLLLLEDNVLIFKKSLHKKIVLFATNKFHRDILSLLQKNNFVADSTLKKLCALDYQLYKLKNVFSLAHVNDFKELYQMLSRKENYNCCSKQMHDRFTHLFIEYKELL
ncbi:MAG: hypothetical protein COZ80_07610 [Ignavibacteria bacterium CG_4_8_14_3_um_filter_37_9]|nr:hypothetical protein [Ignavibacteria bacterium]NCS80752.1 hypothetical protein [Ignavibacteria bacterium]PIP77290.1 MAG: hypothetical protein COW85_09765 [Ignavibacteria bacterium CG22_combo_CG10-13_8_21_14_all_37_15]PIW99023.1 MAG: hypothetical protein COZ80_07610 [Ignavibacteria bacterium CG_4_8_14_3_um_filter_37_9]PIX93671.1 MAG: hypothetical protein COZ25_09475 [Ignavibacteria bacterium CG_4_10_14_3_um_filter_37_18]